MSHNRSLQENRNVVNWFILFIKVLLDATDLKAIMSQAYFASLLCHRVQGRPGAPLWTASLRLRTVENRLGESFWDARTGQSSLGCLALGVVNPIGDAG